MVALLACISRRCILQYSIVAIVGMALGFGTTFLIARTLLKLYNSISRVPVSL